MNPYPSTQRIPNLANPAWPHYLLLITGAAGFIFLAFITWFHTQPPVFDEPYFLENVRLFEQHGLTRQFLVNMQDQAPGPLYEFVHILMKPLTGLQTPGVRLVNVGLLGLTILLLARIFQVLKGIHFYEALLWAMSLIAVPMVWQVAGMALTEMPTIFFSMIAVLFLVKTLRLEERSAVKSSITALFGGLALGLAILGRSPFILVSLCLPVLLFGEWQNRNRWRTVLIFIIAALGISLPVFIIWGGLVPPQQAIIAQGYSLWHGILAFAYAAIFTLLVAPKWLVINKRVLIYMGLTYVVFFLVNSFITQYEYIPFNYTLEKIFPAYLMTQPYVMLLSPLLATIAVYFIGCTAWRGWQNRNDRLFLFFLFCGIAILASCFKITHLFSTRYVAQAAPFFLLVFYAYDRFTPSKSIRCLIGMTIGYFSLETYIHFNS